MIWFHFPIFRYNMEEEARQITGTYELCKFIPKGNDKETCKRLCENTNNCSAAYCERICNDC